MLDERAESSALSSQPCSPANNGDASGSNVTLTIKRLKSSKSFTC